MFCIQLLINIPTDTISTIEIVIQTISSINENAFFILFMLIINQLF